ncbi:histone-lysine N-methyltransferase SETMAR [Trichonephila clavipes]|nr:histone-lysine N-methyltransferase SETMAR [Trichonephila clavipes]
MESDKQHFRHILLFYYIKGKNAIQARKKLTDVYGGVLTVRQCQNWFAKFRSGNFDVEDAPLRNLCRRIDVCDSLLKRRENDPFLKRIITGDEKGHGAKKDEPAQTISKVDIHQKKLLPDNTAINSEVNCHQLDKLNDALQQKRSELINRKGVVFHQDNARPHTSLVTRQKLLQLEWDTMPHPPYSPDLETSDYYLFRSLQKFLDGKNFTSNEEVKNHLDQFFASKDQKIL